MRTDEYIICAAIYINDKLFHWHQPLNIKEGYIICGHRHHNCFNTYLIIGGGFLDRDKQDITQGFISSKNYFYNREDAAKIAYKAGQIKEINNCLMSEDLY